MGSQRLGARCEQHPEFADLLIQKHQNSREPRFGESGTGGRIECAKIRDKGTETDRSGGSEL
jgi:hypothetical protein